VSETILDRGGERRREKTTWKRKTNTERTAIFRQQPCFNFNITGGYLRGPLGDGQQERKLSGFNWYSHANKRVKLGPKKAIAKTVGGMCARDIRAKKKV